MTTFDFQEVRFLVWRARILGFACGIGFTCLSALLFGF